MKHFLWDRTDRLFRKGQKALAARDFAGAADYLRAAIKTDPSYPHLYMYLGVAEAERGDLEQAEVEFSRAIGLDPQNFVFQMELGVRYLDAGKPEAALPRFEQATILAPGNILVRATFALRRRRSAGPASMRFFLPCATCRESFARVCSFPSWR